MADTIREKIIKNALTQLALITTGNGYAHTMGAPLRAVRTFDPEVLPVSVIFPGVEENTRQFAKDNLVFDLRIESFMSTTGVNPNVIQESMLGDLRKNLTNPAAVWSIYTEDIFYLEGGPVDQPEPDGTVAAVRVDIRVKYKTDIGNPYLNS